MSDKTNQATPKLLTFAEFKIRYCYEAGDGWRMDSNNTVPKRVFDWCQREKSSLLAENEKLRGAMEEINNLQSDGNLLTSGVLLQKIQSIARAALSGEQEGTPLK